MWKALYLPVKSFGYSRCTREICKWSVTCWCGHRVVKSSPFLNNAMILQDLKLTFNLVHSPEEATINVHSALVSDLNLNKIPPYREKSEYLSSHPHQNCLPFPACNLSIRVK